MSGNFDLERIYLLDQIRDEVRETHSLTGRNALDQRVMEAMLRVPRHAFVPDDLQYLAYANHPLPIGRGQTISQPYMVAAMTEAAQVSPGDKVLEIGTGSGYQAAILAYLGAEVITMERVRCLAESARERLARLGYHGVRVIPEDGSEGYPAGAPYNAILVPAAAPAVPQALVSQLAEGGRLVIPVGTLQLQTLQVISKHGEEMSVRELDACQFVPLVGKQAWPEGRN